MPPVLSLLAKRLRRDWLKRRVTRQSMALIIMEYSSLRQAVTGRNLASGFIRNHYSIGTEDPKKDSAAYVSTCQRISSSEPSTLTPMRGGSLGS